VATNASIVSEIPAMLLMNDPVGPSLLLTYAFYPNGTIQVSDQNGDSFAMGPLSGLPAGTLGTKLVANSTTAIESYDVTGNAGSIANVSVTYTVRHQYCQPAGLEVDITGSADWAANANGTLSIGFNKTPILSQSGTIWFGNKSGVMLGLDWNDSRQFDPVFSNDELTYSVSHSFSIDPSIIASSGDSSALQGSSNRKVLYASGLYWMFYNNNTFGSSEANLVYSTSANGGITWSTPTPFRSVSSGGGSDGAAGFSVWFDGTHFYYVFDYEGSYIYFREGTPSPSGTITWSASEQTVANNGGASTTSFASAFVTVDSTGHPWVVYDEMTLSGGSYHEYPYASESSTTGGTWTTAGGFPVQLTTTAGSWTVEALPLTSGKMAFLWATNQLWINTWSGSAFNTADEISTSVGDGGFFSYSGLSSGSTVELAYRGGSGSLIYQNYSYSSGLSTAKSFSVTWADSGASPVISTDGSNFWVEWSSADSSATAISYVNYTSSSHTWSPVSTFATDSIPSDDYVSGILSAYAGVAVVAYEGGSSSPCNIKFASLPSSIQTASSNPDSWSKPGISPYESYFAGETEYVAPGNGLLGVLQSDLVLQGRGLNLSVTRVFSTPYAFVSSSPYGYDNYTLTNLGYGWALNFPWMGTYDLHLADGQAYPYAWTGNMFQYNGGTNFMLVNDGSSTGYTLYLPDGTQYQFNSAEQLTTITDHTDNNSISFSYGSNNYISQITDTISRTVTFSYNSNNTLASISSGGITTRYYYSGDDLSSVKDAEGRVTTYQYATGTNNWLLSAVLYPTGGKTTYTYGSAALTVDLKTYYVTLRNIYSSSTALSQTDSIAYSTTNNNVVWSNETESNGVTTQGYVDNYFQGGYKSFSRVYDVNSSSST
jgi:hypothetical protein